MIKKLIYKNSTKHTSEMKCRVNMKC